MAKLTIKNLDHLGIIAGIVDELGIVDYSGFRTTEVRQILMGQDFGNPIATSHL